ncbi:MAG TPA: hypothetical protein VFD33_07685, partial [Bacillota bacterium]|nr:hypothetical protein [Bacillota bacterium]
MEYDNIETFINDCLKSIATNNLEMKRQSIQEQITILDQGETSDPGKYKSLLEELNRINSEIGRRHTGKEGSP